MGNQLTLDGGTTLDVTDNWTVATNRGITLGDTDISSDINFNIAANKTMTVSSVLGGSTNYNTLIVKGGGTLTLAGANNYAGKTTITGGSTVSMNADRLGTAPPSPIGDQLTLDNGTLATTANTTLPVNRGITLTNNNGIFNVSSGTWLRVLGTIESWDTNPTVISYTGGFTLTGGGTLILTTTTNLYVANTYNGKTIITNGTLSIADESSLGYSPPFTDTPDQLTLNGGTLQTTANMSIDDTYRGITLNNSSTINVNNNTSLTISNSIAGTSTALLTKAGSGTLVLAASNSYAGGTAITSGLVNFSTLDNLGTGGVTFNGGGLQWATGSTVDVSSRTLTFSGSAVSAIFNTNGNDVVLGTSIGAGGAGTLVKNGNGILSLNASNNYSGGTTVTAGEVKLGNNNALGGASAGRLTISGGATTDLYGFSPTVSGVTLTSGTISDTGASPGTITSTSAFDLRSGTVSAKLGGAAGVSKTTTGLVTLTASNPYTGGTTISGGTLYTDTAATLGANSTGNNITINSTGVLTLTNSTNVGSNQTMTVNAGGVVAATSTYGFVADLLSKMSSSSAGGVAIASDNSENLTFTSSLSFGASGTPTYTGTITPYNNVYKLGGGGGTLTFNSPLVNNGATPRSLIVGGTGLTGTVLLSHTANTYSGGTTVTSGMLQVDVNSKLGSNVNGNNVTVDGGSLTLTSSNNIGSNQTLTVNANGMVAADAAYGPIQGLINRVVAGSSGGIAIGTDSSENMNFAGSQLSLGTTGTATYSGTITPDNNTYRFGGGGGTLSVATMLDGASRSVVVGSASGGTVVLAPSSGSNTYGGGTTINSASLQLGGFTSFALPMTTTVTVNGGTFDIAGYIPAVNGVVLNGGTITDSLGVGYLMSKTALDVRAGTISAVVTDYLDPFTYVTTVTDLTKTGTGIVYLTGANAYTGITKISTGTLSTNLIATGGVACGIGQATNDYWNWVLDGGTFQFTGVGGLTDRSLSVTPNGGTLRLTNSGVASGYGLNIWGNIVCTGTGDRTLTVFADASGNSSASRLGGSIRDPAGGGKLQLIKQGNGRLWLDNVANVKDFSGGFRIEGGMVYMNGVDMLPIGNGKGNLYIASGAQWIINNFDQNINGLDGAGNIGQNNNGNTKTITLGNGNANGDFSGTIIPDTGGGNPNGGRYLLLTKVGTGTQILRGTSYYAFGGTGTTYKTTAINGGTLDVYVLVNGTLGSSIGASGPAAQNLTFSGGTLKYSGGTSSTDRLFTVYSAGATLDASGTGAITWSNGGSLIMGAAGAPHPFTLTGTSTLDNTFNPVIPDYLTNPTSLYKTGAGTWVLGSANTYTGVTSISGGMLAVSSLANGGTASNIGQATNVASNLVLNGATLQYRGAGSSTDHLFTLGAGSSAGTIDAAGSGAVTWTNSGALAFTGTGTRTLTLTGSNTGSNTLAASIGDDASGATSVAKTGAGTWVLSGSSAYTGGTTISGSGILSISNDLNLGGASGGVTLNGGKLAATAAISMARPITINYTGGGIDTAANVVEVTGSQGTTWGAGTLTVDGSSGGELKLNRTGGTVSVDPAAVLQINSGAKVELTGTPATKSGANFLKIINNSLTSLLISGSTAQQVGAITGTGATEVAANATLIASSISQNHISIGSGAKLVIRPSGSGPLSDGADLTSISPVPEPSTWAMLLLAAMALGIYWRRSR